VRLFFVHYGRKRRACGCYFPSVQTEIYVLKVLFSIPRNGKVSKSEAIFCLSRTEKKTMRNYFLSVRTEK